MVNRVSVFAMMSDPILNPQRIRLIRISIMVVIVNNHMVSKHCVRFNNIILLTNTAISTACQIDTFINVCLIALNGFIRRFCAIIVSPLTMFDSINSSIRISTIKSNQSIEWNAVIYLDTVSLRHI